MKLLFCIICGDLFGMKEWMKRCYCGNICGRYLSNNSDIGIHVLHPEYARIVSISSHFLMEVADCDEFDWPNLKDTYFDKKRSHVLMFKIDSEMAKGSGVIEYESEKAIMGDCDAGEDKIRKKTLADIRRCVKNGDPFIILDRQFMPISNELDKILTTIEKFSKNTEEDAKELRKALNEYDGTPIEGRIKHAEKKLKKQ